MQNAKHKNGVVGVNVAIKHDIRKHDANADGCPQLAARRAALGKLFRTLIERITGDGGSIGIGRCGDDNPRH